MSSKVRSLHGRLEYDPFHLYEGNGDYNLYVGTRTPYCILVLSLFDLPVNAAVKVETFFELHKRYHTLRAFQVPAWERNYREELNLQVSGRLKVEIHTKSHVHMVEYRIDPDQLRPVRQQRDKLELHVVESEGESPSLPTTKVPQVEQPPGSLWSYLEEESNR